MASTLRITVFDYGAGNLHSLAKALERPEHEVRIEGDPNRLLSDTDLLVLPGVGAFDQAASRLAPMRDSLRTALEGGLPALGICLGMQLLFEASDEGSGTTRGVGLFEGRVARLKAARIPQIGWNSIEWEATMDEVPALEAAYYANSYVARPVANSRSAVLAWSEHGGDRFPAVVKTANTLGTQFHPEKSSYQGISFVQRFLEHIRTRVYARRTS